MNFFARMSNRPAALADRSVILDRDVRSGGLIEGRYATFEKFLERDVACKRVGYESVGIGPLTIEAATYFVVRIVR